MGEQIHDQPLPPRFQFDEVLTILRDFSQEQLPIIADSIRSGTGLTHEQAQAKAAIRARFAAQLGIETGDLDDMSSVSSAISTWQFDIELQAKLERENGIKRDIVRAPSYTTGAFFGPRSMTSFTNGVRTFARLTAEPIDVDIMEGSITIYPEDSMADINVRLAAAFRAGQTIERFESWNDWAAKEQARAPGLWPADITKRIDVSEIAQLLLECPE